MQKVSWFQSNRRAQLHLKIQRSLPSCVWLRNWQTMVDKMLAIHSNRLMLHLQQSKSLKIFSSWSWVLSAHLLIESTTAPTLTFNKIQAGELQKDSPTLQLLRREKLALKTKTAFVSSYKHVFFCCNSAHFSEVIPKDWLTYGACL